MYLNTFRIEASHSIPHIFLAITPTDATTIIKIITMIIIITIIIIIEIVIVIVIVIITYKLLTTGTTRTVSEVNTKSWLPEGNPALIAAPQG